jgi:hypothetical protein
MTSQYSLLLGVSPGRAPKSSCATRSHGAGRHTDSSTRPFRCDDTCGEILVGQGRGRKCVLTRKVQPGDAKGSAWVRERGGSVCGWGAVLCETAWRGGSRGGEGRKGGGAWDQKGGGAWQSLGGCDGGLQAYFSLHAAAATGSKHKHPRCLNTPDRPCCMTGPVASR